MERDVPQSSIQGAALTGAALSVLIPHDGSDIFGLATTATSAAVLTAYLAMTPGGEGIRVVGEYVWIGSNTIAQACQTIWMDVRDDNKNKNTNESMASNGMLATTMTSQASAPLPSPSVIKNAWDTIIMTLTSGRASLLKSGNDAVTKK